MTIEAKDATLFHVSVTFRPDVCSSSGDMRSDGIESGQGVVAACQVLQGRSSFDASIHLQMLQPAHVHPDA